MESLNETWEEKMQRTQQVQKEREKALEELGISVERDNVGVHTPKRVCSSFVSAVTLLTLMSRVLPDAPSSQLGKSMSTSCRRFSTDIRTLERRFAIELALLTARTEHGLRSAYERVFDLPA